jgi:hypothetical protein
MNPKQPSNEWDEFDPEAVENNIMEQEDLSEEEIEAICRSYSDGYS